MEGGRGYWLRRGVMDGERGDGVWRGVVGRGEGRRWHSVWGWSPPPTLTPTPTPPGTDPALLDPELAKRLRRNRTVALNRLDAVIQRYAQLQDESEEEERGRKRAARLQGGAGSNREQSGAVRWGECDGERGVEVGNAAEEWDGDWKWG